MKSSDPKSPITELKKVAIVTGENLKVDGGPMRAGGSSGTGSKPSSRIRELGLDLREASTPFAAHSASSDARDLRSQSKLS
jgi:hypothetical protein